MNRILKARIIEHYGGQWKFAQKLDVHESYISAIVRGRRNPSDATKAEIAKMLRSEVKELFPDATN